MVEPHSTFTTRFSDHGNTTVSPIQSSGTAPAAQKVNRANPITVTAKSCVQDHRREQNSNRLAENHAQLFLRIFNTSR